MNFTYKPVFWVIFTLVVIGGTFWSIREARRKDREQNSQTTLTANIDSVGKSVEAPVYEPEIPTINLPYQEQFIAVISSAEGTQLGISPPRFGGSVGGIITRNLITGKITVWIPGMSPHSWQPALHINEN